MPTFNPLSSEMVNQLANLVGEENVSTSDGDRSRHAQDMSGYAAHPPDVVIWPTTGQQVAEVLRLANEARVPVTPWGIGSSLEGNPIPLHGGILLTTEKMNRVVELHAEDFQVTVQPGIGHVDLNEKLAQWGLFFPPDPGANATIGGMLANNAAGIRTVKYGASKDNVLQMRVATANGRLIRVGSRSIKQSAGYDLLHLFVGSEGTLGVITEATLKLVPVPQLMSAVVAAFPSVAHAVEAVVAVRGSGLEPAALEFIDANTAELVSRYEEGVDFGRRPTLFMEFHAVHETTLALGLALVREICEELGATAVRATADTRERNRLWRARHNMFESVVRTHPGVRWQLLDVSVPLSAYTTLVPFVEKLMADNGVAGYMVGHAGDGNLHATMPFTDEAGYEAMRALNAQVVAKAQSLGGTMTGEHGVGLGKSRYMAQEHGEALGVMRSIKQTLDPNGILNPGKIFPA